MNTQEINDLFNKYEETGDIRRPEYDFEEECCLDLFTPTAVKIEVFAIKKTENGEVAFIGYKIPNGNFHFEQVPYTGPELVYSREYEEITGFKNHETRAAYEQGKEDGEKNVLSFIERWDGSKDNEIEELLYSKAEGHFERFVIDNPTIIVKWVLLKLGEDVKKAGGDSITIFQEADLEPGKRYKITSVTTIEKI